MKRIIKIALTLFVTFLITACLVNAQEKKNGQRIKIIVTDKEGTKIEIDTLIKGDLTADSIKLKNGEVIFLTSHGASGKVKHIEGENGRMYVTVTSDNEDDTEVMKEISVLSSDSEHHIEGGEGRNFIIIRDGKHLKGGKDENVVTWSSSEGNSKGASVIYINEGKGSTKEGKKKYDVKVITDEKDNKLEKTKYVIAKDGMVVSIEGNDEAKVNDLVKEIESKLGVSKTKESTKQVIKEGTKKSNKE